MRTVHIHNNSGFGELPLCVIDQLDLHTRPKFESRKGMKEINQITKRHSFEIDNINCERETLLKIPISACTYHSTENRVESTKTNSLNYPLTNANFKTT